MGDFLKAYNLAKEAFKDKVDKGGHPYFDHLTRVCNNISDEKKLKCTIFDTTLNLWYEKAEIVAILHDYIEDTEATLDDLRQEGFDDEIVNAIDAISRKDKELYMEFIDRVSDNALARLVKKYDLEDNMNILRLKEITDKDLQRIKKYWYAWKYLNGEISYITAHNIIHPNNKVR